MVLAGATFITEKHRFDLEFIEILKAIEGSLNYVTYHIAVVVLKYHDFTLQCGGGGANLDCALLHRYPCEMPIPATPVFVAAS